MNTPSGGISGWVQSEMVSNNDEVDFDKKSSYFKFMGIAPPISHLAELKNLFKFGFLAHKISLDLVMALKTGDISADMVIDKGCKFSILGHSERREFYNETNRDVSEKLRICLEKNIVPVICIGESLEDYNAGKTLEVLDMQIKEIFTSLSSKKTVVIAYEPVWAIGSGKTPTVDEVNNIHQHIKDIVQSVAEIEAISVIYGGSVNCENAKKLFSTNKY